MPRHPAGSQARRASASNEPPLQRYPEKLSRRSVSIGSNSCRVEGWGLKVEGSRVVSIRSHGFTVEGWGLRAEGWGLRAEGSRVVSIGSNGAAVSAASSAVASYLYIVYSAYLYIVYSAY